MVEGNTQLPRTIGPQGKKGNKKLLSNGEPGYTDNGEEIDDLKEAVVVAEKKNSDTQHRSSLHNGVGTIRLVIWSRGMVLWVVVMGMAVRSWRCW